MINPCHTCILLRTEQKKQHSDTFDVYQPRVRYDELAAVEHLETSQTRLRGVMLPHCASDLKRLKHKAINKRQQFQTIYE